MPYLLANLIQRETKARKIQTANSTYQNRHTENKGRVFLSFLMTAAAAFHALHSCLFLQRNAKRSENKMKPKTVQVIATVLQHFSPSSSIVKSTTAIER